MRNRRDHTDNVISLDKLRRKRRRTHKKAQAVPQQQAKEERSQDRRVPSVPYADREEGASDPRRITALLAVAALLMVFLCCAIVLMTGVLDVKEIRVEGLTQYTREEVLARSGLYEGINILGFRKDAVQANIETDPMLRYMNLQRVFPSKLILTVKERLPACAAYHLGSYVLLDDEYTVLGLESQAPSGDAYPIVTGLIIGTMEAGQALDFQDDVQECAIRTIMDSLRASGALEYVRGINLTSLSSIIMTADGNVTVDAGSVEDMDVKANWIATMVPKLLDAGYTGGVLYVSGGKNASYSPESGETGTLTETGQGEDQAVSGSGEGGGDGQTEPTASPLP